MQSQLTQKLPVEQAVRAARDPEGPIDPEDAWTVIKAYFQQHGLVS